MVDKDEQLIQCLLTLAIWLIKLIWLNKRWPKKENLMNSSNHLCTSIFVSHLNMNLIIWFKAINLNFTLSMSLHSLWETLLFYLIFNLKQKRKCFDSSWMIFIKLESLITKAMRNVSFENEELSWINNKRKSLTIITFLNHLLMHIRLSIGFMSLDWRQDWFEIHWQEI